MIALWIRNASVVDARGAYRADVVTRGERIEALGVVRPFGAYDELDAEGLWLVAGRVDRNGERLEPRGPIHPGELADLVALDPVVAEGVDPDACGAGLLEGGASVRGGVRWVMVRGEVEHR